MTRRSGAKNLAREVLPIREGGAPRTQRQLPHMQLDQWPPAEMVENLWKASVLLPHVRTQESRMACPLTCALTMPDRYAHGPGESFIDDHEFCHLHPPPRGGVHLTLPEDLRREAIESGWAEEHPAARGGMLPPTVVMVYAPRDERELEIVMLLVDASRRFAEGES